MIIVEGMDGSGKTRLVERLKKDLGIEQAQRASTSVGGPVPAVFDWASRDVHGWQSRNVQVYDRHPFISELIYGPIVRGKLDSQFFGYEGFRKMRAFRQMTLVIYCKVPWETTLENLQNDDAIQMAGVLDNSKRLWLMYQTFFSQYTNDPMTHVKVWDYTTPENYDQILAECEAHIKHWNGEA